MEAVSFLRLMHQTKINSIFHFRSPPHFSRLRFNSCSFNYIIMSRRHLCSDLTATSCLSQRPNSYYSHNRWMHMLINRHLLLPVYWKICLKLMLNLNENVTIMVSEADNLPTSYIQKFAAHIFGQWLLKRIHCAFTFQATVSVLKIN